MPAQALAIALHVFGAVVWVGGMFAIYVCLRPALGTLEPPQRFRLLHAALRKFLPWVWASIVLIVANGYYMVFATFGGFSGIGMHIYWMQLFGWAMIGLFFWLFHGPWLAFKRAVAVEDWPGAGANVDQMRQIMAVNMPLGMVVILIGVSGRYW